jgi:hypothetical protein
VRWIWIAISAALLAACAPADPPVGTGGGPALEISVTQGRADEIAGVLAVEIENRLRNEVIVTSVTLTSTIFTQPLTRPEAKTKIATGSRVAIRIPVVNLDCQNQQRTGRAQIAYTVGSENFVGSFRVRDPDDYFTRIQQTGCFAAKVASVATFTLDPELRIRQVGDKLVAEATLDVDYFDEGIELLNLRGTTLLAHVDPNTLKRREFRIIEGIRPSRIALTLMPNRCDPHAIAEDKRGTIFPLELFLESEQKKGIVLVRADEQLRQQLYEYVLSACGLQDK